MPRQDPLLTPGRLLLTLGNLAYSIGAFVADFNATHVYNPRWPPHARFHNGQTMSLGVLLAATSLYFTYRSPAGARSPPGGGEEARRAPLYAAAIGSWYCLAGLSAILYPGTDWMDPDVGVGGGQKWIFSGVVVLMWVGYGLERRRLGKLKAA